jgi:hypothetical protein
MIITLEKDEMLGKPFPAIPLGWQFIVGGAVRSWFCGETLSDIDLAFNDEKQMKAYSEILEKAGYKKVFSHENADTFKNGSVIIQTLKKYWTDIDSMFRSFDFDLCCFAIDSQGCIFTTKKAVLSVLRKRLSVNTIQSGYELDSLRRAFKYFEKGYKPCYGCLHDIAKSLGMDEETLKKQIEFYADGSARVIRFD